jgi:hypothetical protein
VRHSLVAPHTKAPLNELSKIMGLPGKPEDMDGNEVERYSWRARSSRLQNTARATWSTRIASGWLRYELFRGRLSESEHQASERNLADFTAARVNTKARGLS